MNGPAVILVCASIDPPPANRNESRTPGEWPGSDVRLCFHQVSPFTGSGGQDRFKNGPAVMFVCASIRSSSRHSKRVRTAS